jgi:hypothetical protein
MWWNALVDELGISIEPRQIPYSIFIDDTLRNFVASHKVLGLLAPSSEKTPDEIPKLSYYAKRAWYKYNINLTYDAKSGIPTKAFRILGRSVHIFKNDVQAVYLDWDKTLSVHSSFKAETITKYTAECYFGGRERMRAMKYFFLQLKKYNIDVCVLTSNGRAKRDQDSFRKALNYVRGGWVRIEFTDEVKVKQINKI